MFSFRGSTLALDGRHQVYAVFVSIAGRKHTPEQRDLLLARARVSLGYLGEKARAHADNCVSFALQSVVLDDPLAVVVGGPGLMLPVSRYDARIAEAIERADPALTIPAPTLRDIWQEALNAHEATSVSYLFFLPILGRSYATSSTSRDGYDFTILFAPPADVTPGHAHALEYLIAHEFMHLAGMGDLYDVRDAANWHLRSLMNHACPSLQPADTFIDPLSAHAVGLGPGYPPTTPPPPTPFMVTDIRGAFVPLR